MATNWILSRRRYALADDADAVVDLFFHGLQGAQAPSRGRRAATASHKPSRASQA